MSRRHTKHNPRFAEKFELEDIRKENAELKRFALSVWEALATTEISNHAVLEIGVECGLFTTDHDDPSAYHIAEWVIMREGAHGRGRRTADS